MIKQENDFEKLANSIIDFYDHIAQLDDKTVLSRQQVLQQLTEFIPDDLISFDMVL